MYVPDIVWQDSLPVCSQLELKQKEKDNKQQEEEEKQHFVEDIVNHFQREDSQNLAEEKEYVEETHQDKSR